MLCSRAVPRWTGAIARDQIPTSVALSVRPICLTPLTHLVETVPTSAHTKHNPCRRQVRHQRRLRCLAFSLARQTTVSSKAICKLTLQSRDQETGLAPAL